MSAPTPARRAAYEVLRRVFEHDAWADRALRAAAERHRLEGRERSLAQQLAYGAVQRRGTSDHLIAILASRSPKRIDPPLLAALRLGLFELLYLEGSASHAAVDQAVALAAGAASGSGRRRRGAGLVNAVLRRAAREREQLLGSLDDRDPRRAAVMHSLPPWIVELLWRELGAERARRVLAAANRPPERAYRVGAADRSRESILAELAAVGVEAAAAPGPGPLAASESIVVAGGRWSAVDRLVAAGALVPQSRPSAAAVELLDPRAGERVLDLCAGPGIKASAIAGRIGDGELVAVERDRGRASELEARCASLGLGNVRVVVADATEADLGSDYDRVLVDPPCSGLGTLASRPDLRWRRSPGAIEEMAAAQRRIAARGAAALRAGGTIVYSTCTISAEENERVVERLLAADPALAADPLGAETPALAAADPRFLQTAPDRDGTDGFFFARMRSEG